MVEIVIYPDNSVHIDNGQIQNFTSWNKDEFNRRGIDYKRFTHSIKRLNTPVIKQVCSTIYIIFYASARCNKFSGKRRGRPRTQKTIN
jgi:hypothetical protein